MEKRKKCYNLNVKNRIYLIVLAILLLLAFFVVAGWFWLAKNKEPKTIYEKIANQVISPDVIESATLDNDDDGLRNWEEALWKTDPNNKDTDKDGYSDKEETILGYSPTDPTSNPKTGKKDENNFLADNQKSQQPVNLTQSFAQIISSQIQDPTQLEQVDLSNPLSMVDKNTGQALLNFIAGLNPQIALSEIKTGSDNSFTAVQKYVSEIEKAMPKSPYQGKSEEEILSEAIETENFKKVDEFINYFEIAIANMKKIAVPSDFLQIHKRETELLMATKKVYESVKEVNSDPLKTVLALQENQKIREEMAGLIQNFLKIAQTYAE